MYVHLTGQIIIFIYYIELSIWFHALGLLEEDIAVYDFYLSVYVIYLFSWLLSNSYFSNYLSH